MIRETGCDPIPLPAAMSADVAGYRWARDHIGESGGAVYRLHGKQEAPDLYLKHGTGAVADDIAGEAARLGWLSEHLPVPRMRGLARVGDEAWLLMTAIPGRTAYQLLEEQPDAGPAIVDAIAHFLRRLHAIPADLCPFDSGHASRLRLARARIDADLVDTEDFDEEREGWTAEQVWTELQALLPLAVEPVVTHGDFSLDNILMQDGKVTGCIDLGRAGVADRYQDLAILWNCLDEFGPDLQAQLFHRYGIEQIDQPRLRFHLLLDELF